MNERGVPINAIETNRAAWRYNPNMTTSANKSLTPLVAAVAGKHEALALALLAMSDTPGEGNVDVLDLSRTFDPNGGTLAHYAAEQGQLKVLKAIIGRYGALLEMVDKKLCTPLLRAIAYGHANVVNSLLAMDAVLNISHISHPGGGTVAHYASFN